MDRKINKTIILLSLLIAAVIFLLGFLLSYSFSYSKINQINSIQEEIKSELLNLENNNTTYSNLCGNNSLYAINQRLDYIGGITDILEKKLGKSNEQVLNQKKLYSLLEYEHLLIVKKMNSECNKSLATILFFYSNNENQRESEDMGYVLDVSKAKYTDKIMIYSFDYNLNIEVINMLKQTYKIDKAPAVILNENALLYSIQDIKNIEELLNQPESP